MPETPYFIPISEILQSDPDRLVRRIIRIVDPLESHDFLAGFGDLDAAQKHVQSYTHQSLFPKPGPYFSPRNAAVDFYSALTAYQNLGHDAYFSQMTEAAQNAGVMLTQVLSDAAIRDFSTDHVFRGIENHTVLRGQKELYPALIAISDIAVFSKQMGKPLNDRDQALTQVYLFATALGYAQIYAVNYLRSQEDHRKNGQDKQEKTEKQFRRHILTYAMQQFAQNGQKDMIAYIATEKLMQQLVNPQVQSKWNKK